MPSSSPAGHNRQRASGPAAFPGSSTVRGIHGRIRHDIVTLKFRPGERLSENELSLRFGTSRAPVREALIRLVEEGLIEVLPQRGSFVSRISLAAMERARFVREALEVAIVRRTAEQGLSKTAQEKAHAILADQEKVQGEPEHFTLADDAFHRALADDIGIAQIWAVLEREKSQFDRVRFLSLPSATPVAVLIDQHRAILDAILRRDPGAAEVAMRVHLSEILKIVEKLAAEHPDLIVKDL
ncbi:GntR family transcriptional regulator [Microvirga terricola]|uniref:GntR family transcriptional regulator n=1 Tax=Microvirga terricola TaxID=2719797 RepID=A0ABX0VAZ8_9HYPH|nr:GntR family transcriptional regulator [Microvirga terricola]NIX77027.1 GntR family transcriptional regulator [Microvirga terricola]